MYGRIVASEVTVTGRRYQFRWVPMNTLLQVLISLQITEVQRRKLHRFLRFNYLPSKKPLITLRSPLTAKKTATSINTIDIAVQYHEPLVPLPMKRDGPTKMKGKDQASLNRPATIRS